MTQGARAQSLGFSIFTLIISMISIQCGASVAKQMFPIVGSTGTTLVRLILATLMLFIVWRPWKEKLNPGEFFPIALYGASLGLMNLSFYLALERIPLGLAVALEFSGPLAIALGTSRRILDFVWAILAMIGVLLILPISNEPGAINKVGVLFALTAAFFWGLYILFGKKAGAKVSGGKATSLGMLAATLVVLPAGLKNSLIGALNVKILPMALAMALLSSALPYSLEMMALKRLPAKTFGILMSLEPVFAALSGLAFLNEELSLSQWAAIGCIFAASLGSSLSTKR